MERGWAREGQLCGEGKLSEPQKRSNHNTVEHTREWHVTHWIWIWGIRVSGNERACRVYETWSTRLERRGGLVRIGGKCNSVCWRR